MTCITLYTLLTNLVHILFYIIASLLYTSPAEEENLSLFQLQESINKPNVAKRREGIQRRQWWIVGNNCKNINEQKALITK